MKLNLCAILFSLVIMLAPLCSSVGAEADFEGDITLQGQLVHVNGNEAKFDEYGDTKDGIYGTIGLIYEKDSYFTRFNAYDIGYDTQKYTLDGGMWGKFKYDLFYNEIPHNITFGALTYFSGAGSNRLTGAFNPDISTWKRFDYSTERKQYGGGVKLDLLKPFYLDVSVQREDKSGIKPAGLSSEAGLDIGEVPEPIDYRTDSFNIEAGVSAKPLFASVSYYYSKFENDNQALFLPGDALTLPPDNEYHKLTFKGAVMLPLNSRFSTNIGFGSASSDFRLINSDGTDFGRTFDGRIDTTNVDFVLTTNPVSFLDGKVFYKYYQRKNKSDQIDDGEEVNDLLSYNKTSYGAQLGCRLPENLRLTAGYSHLKTGYTDRVDVNSRTDDSYSVDLAWSGLDFMTVRGGYERTHRNTDRPAPDDPVEGFIGRFDVSPFDRDTYKASVDIYPVANLDVSFGYKYKKTNYKDTILGLREDKRDEFYMDADYSIGKTVKLFGYLDYEKIRSFQFQRFWVSDPDPATQVSPDFNWDIIQREKNIDYGIGADLYVIPKKLTVRLQHDYVKSDGNADLTYLLASELPSGANNNNIDMSNWDDYRKTSFSVRVVYDVMKPLSVTAGYAYEHFKYNDALLDGYQYTGVDTLAGLTGAYKDQSYNANVVYLALTYKF